MTTIGLSYSLVKISTKCAPALHNQWALIDPHWCRYDSKYPPFDTNGGI